MSEAGDAVVWGNVPMALTLTLIGGLSTGIGGVLGTVNENPRPAGFGKMLGLASGIMICISLVDILPSSTIVIGRAASCFCFLVGAICFSLAARLIPEEDVDIYKKTDVSARSANDIADSVSDLSMSAKQAAVQRSGFVTALGLGIHNLPEGMAVFLSSLKGVKFGLPLAVAIALHNIPEGFAVSAPLYFASKNRYEAVRWSFITGLAEPLGVLFVGVGIFVFGVTPSSFFIECLLSAVSGIMTFVSVRELLPLSIKYCGNDVAGWSVVGGILLMNLFMCISDFLSGEDHV
eukprot:GILK01006758.1.p1 GENE.GILK01006758.1~~GILK01006758.1.p1  ORF type:complete len:302 (-),score=43.24 GILK01006758.1:664-1536(-)